MKKKIKEIIVVEGKTDSFRLKELFEVDTIETNGLGINSEKINLIKHASQTRGVILFLDPDGPGEKIRKICQLNLTNYKQAFIDKKTQKYDKKVGIAESDDNSIIDAIKNIATFNKNNQSLVWKDYLELNFDSKIKRLKITEYFKISECNHKQLFKCLNLMGIDIKKLESIIHDN